MAKFKFPIHLPDSIREKFPKFQKNGGKKNWKKLTRKQKGIRIGAGIAVILVGGMIIFTMGKGKKASTEASGQRTATVQRMDITSSLSSSGTLSPKDTYSITSLVSGEVISADFEEGDQVEKGQVLYVIDSSSMGIGVKLCSEFSGAESGIL